MRTLLRSITPLTGALVGGLTGAVIPIAAFNIENAIGNPTSTAALGLILTLPFGVVGAAVGLGLGWGIGRAARAYGINADIDWQTVFAASGLGVVTGVAIASWLVHMSIST